MFGVSCPLKMTANIFSEGFSVVESREALVFPARVFSVWTQLLLRTAMLKKKAADRHKTGLLAVEQQVAACLVMCQVLWLLLDVWLCQKQWLLASF